MGDRGLLPRAPARWRRTAAVIGVLFGACSLAPGAPPASAVAPAAAPVTSAYRPVGPVRLADTRTGQGFETLGDGTVRVPVAGLRGVPKDAVAAVLTVTVTDTRAGGYVTVWPAGGVRPTVSTLNADEAGQTVANGATVALGAGGAVDVFASMPAAVVVDVVGAYVPASHATAGRFVPMAPVRVADTRTWRGPLGPGERLTVPLGADVPDDALAAVVNLTVDAATGPGYWTAFGTGADQPLASVLNTDAVGQTRAALTVVPLAGRAAFDVVGQTGGHVVADLVGWFTGGTAPDRTDGLFVPLAPRRLVDTRDDASLLAVGGTVQGRVPHCVLAVVGNLTATDAIGGGYLAARPTKVTAASVPAAPASSLNFAADRTVANQLMVSADGGVTVEVAGAPTQVVLDLTGYFVSGPDPTLGDDPKADARGRFAPSVAEVTATSVPADVLVPTAVARLSARTNPINGRRGGPDRPAVMAAGCTIDARSPRTCLVATLDALGFNVASGGGVDRERRLHQAVAVLQLDAGLPATGMADRALFEYLGIWPGSATLGAEEVRVIGTSQQGRPLRALRYGSGPKVVLVVGVTHGDEEAGLRVLLRTAASGVPADVTLWVVPAVNPDGLALDQRFLANGADPNRAAPSQREQAALAAFARSVRPRTGVYFHQNYGWVGGSGASMEPAGAYHAVARLGTLNRSGDCEKTGFLWCPIDDELGSSSVLVELPDVVTPHDVHVHTAALAAVLALP